MALACFGLANRAEAKRCLPIGEECTRHKDCCSGYCYASVTDGGNSIPYCSNP
jgi:hypothetical protein